MGQVKKMMMDLQERGDWPSGLDHKKVCAHHFDDPYLNKVVARNGEEGICSYCGNHGTVSTMQRLMEDVSWKVHMYYESLDNASLLLASSFYDDEKEVIPGFKRIGDYIVPSEAECFESTRELMDELGLESDNDELNQDIEYVFTTNEWIEKDILHEDYRRVLLNKWHAFAKAVTNSQRYTFLSTPEFLPLVKGEETEERKDILSSLKNLIIMQKLIKILSQDSVLYRARRVKDKNKQYAFSDITAAPDNVATVNRMSPAGISMFYASFSKQTAIDECVGDKSDSILVGEFTTKKNLNILDLTHIPGPSFWMENWQENQFLHTFNSEITKKQDPIDTNQLQYIPTQVFTEFLRYMFVDENGERLDGMIYGSSKTKEQNIVLFYNHKNSSNVVDVLNLSVE